MRKIGSLQRILIGLQEVFECFRRDLDEIFLKGQISEFYDRFVEAYESSGCFYRGKMQFSNIVSFKKVEIGFLSLIKASQGKFSSKVLQKVLKIRVINLNLKILLEEAWEVQIFENTKNKEGRSHIKTCGFQTHKIN